MFLSQRKFLAACLMCSVFFLTVPNQSEAAVILITGLISVSTVIADAIILCALFCPGGGNSGDNVSCEASDVGTACTLTSSCSDGSEETYNGTWADAGGGGCDCVVSYPSCPTNYCGMSGGGNYVCGSCVDDSGNPLPSPANNECINLPLPTDALTIEPPLVRKDDSITVNWNLGLNWPPNCTLAGPGLDVTFTGPSDATGSITVDPVNGPHQYTLTCGTETVKANVNLLPEIQES